MPAEKVIVKGGVPPGVRLPGTLVLPDGKQPVRMGSGIITSLISSGGMAIIYEIWNPELEVKRAVKLLHPDHTKESEERFYTEMKITAKLRHANIVEIYGVGRWNGLPFIEMERIDGVTLHKLLAECCRLPPEICTSIGLIMGRALNYSHNQDYVLYGRKYHGIIHRDLKPGNIMITGAGIVKLMDFGIARPMTTSIHTSEGSVVGTMQYLAPEQLNGTITDARADIYSLACVMYEMLTGVRAFPEVNIARLVPDKLSNTFAPLDQFSLKTPPALVNLIHKCMRHDKERRVQNMLEFLRVLGHIHGTLTADPPEKLIARFMHDTRQYRNAARRRRRIRVLSAFVWSAAVLAALLVISLSTQYLLRNYSGSFGLFAASAPTQPAAQETGVAAPVPQTAENPAPSPPAQEPAGSAGTRAAADAPMPRKDASRLAFADRPMPAPRRSAAAPSQPEPQSRTAVAGTSQNEVTAPVAEASGEPSLIERLSAQYRTSNLLAIYSAEVEKGNFQNALELYGHLGPADAQSPRAMLYRIRSARGISDWRAVDAVLGSTDLRDGEFYLEKAMRAYRVKDFAGAQALLEQAESMPAAYIDHASLHQSILYGKALCVSSELDRAPSAQKKQQAMTAWYELKSMLRSNPDHRFFKKADDEIRRINKVEVAQ